MRIGMKWAWKSGALFRPEPLTTFGSISSVLPLGKKEYTVKKKPLSMTLRSC